MLYQLMENFQTWCFSIIIILILWAVVMSIYVCVCVCVFVCVCVCVCARARARARVRVCYSVLQCEIIYAYMYIPEMHFYNSLCNF
jgi:hypothetical protein